MDAPPTPFDVEMSTNVSLKSTDSNTSNLRHRKKSSFITTLASIQGFVEPEVALKSLENPIEDEPDAADHRHGGFWQASSHILTTMIGAGVLGLPSAISWLGWIAGPLLIFMFYVITLITATLLASVHKVNDVRFRRYPEAVIGILGKRDALIVATLQIVNLCLISIAYQIAGAQSIQAFDGQSQECAKDTTTTTNAESTTNPTNTTYESGTTNTTQCEIWQEVLIMGAIELVFSQLPDLDSISWVSAIGAMMSISYSCIALGLSASNINSWDPPPGTEEMGSSIDGYTDTSAANKAFGVMNALGNIAFSFNFSVVLMEIADTIKEPPPAKPVMKKSISVALTIAFLFYLSVGVCGYAAFGNNLYSYGDILTMPGIGPQWVITVANVFVFIHMISAYQVIAQPLFEKAERGMKKKWKWCEEHPIKLRVLFRSAYVCCTTAISCVLPFFSVFTGLIGALVFWPLSVYFPIKLYKTVFKIGKGKRRLLMVIDVGMALVSIAAIIGSIRNLITTASSFQLF